MNHDQGYEILFLMIIVNYEKGYNPSSINIRQLPLPLNHSILHYMTKMLMKLELVSITKYPQTSL